MSSLPPPGFTKSDRKSDLDLILGGLNISSNLPSHSISSSSIWNTSISNSIHSAPPTGYYHNAVPPPPGMNPFYTSPPPPSSSSIFTNPPQVLYGKEPPRSMLGNEPVAGSAKELLSMLQGPPPSFGGQPLNNTLPMYPNQSFRPPPPNMGFPPPPLPPFGYYSMPFGPIPYDKGPPMPHYRGDCPPQFNNNTRERDNFRERDIFIDRERELNRERDNFRERDNLRERNNFRERDRDNFRERERERENDRDNFREIEKSRDRELYIGNTLNYRNGESINRPPSPSSIVNSFTTGFKQKLEEKVICNIEVWPEKVETNEKIEIRWSIQADRHSPSDLISLYRAGQSNAADKAITTRPAQIPRHNKNRNMINNVIHFRAPKAVGKFDFRYFHEGNEVPVARSNVLHVSLSAAGIEETVEFLSKKLTDDESYGSTARQLARVVEQIENPIQKTAASQLYKLLVEIVEDGLKIAKDILIEGEKEAEEILKAESEMTEEEREKERMEKEEKEILTGSEKVIAVVKELSKQEQVIVKSKKKSANLQAALRQALTAFEVNRFVCPYLDASCLLNIKEKQASFCCLCETFQENEEELNHHLRISHGLMTVVPPSSLLTSGLPSLNSFLVKFCDKLFPSPEFMKTLHSLMMRLSNLISKLSIAGGRVYLFGSSANNFGTQASDVDVCLALPLNKGEDEVSPSQVVKELAALLKEEGMINVDDSRHSARIPIVIAHDVTTNLDVDICVNNLLAVRNTNLLKCYSNIDVRVRQLAYLIKYWVKMRKINNASEGTLCSYGYILMLIHFLQNTTPPVIPILNDLHPSWKGEEVKGKHADLPTMPVVGIDGVAYDTYFFEPKEGPNSTSFTTFSSRNKESVSSLLLNFLYKFAFEFEYRKLVVSTRKHGGVDREDKGRDFGWKRHSRLTIEDPFEIGYDVAHVIKDDAHRAITVEFARAYSILATSLNIPGSNFMETFEQMSTEALESPVKIIRVLREVKEDEKE